LIVTIVPGAPEAGERLLIFGVAVAIAHQNRDKTVMMTAANLWGK
jgi:hypothetical protein